MAGDRKEPGLGKPNPDKDADKTNAQDDFLDLIPERLSPRGRPAEPDDAPPLSAEPAGAEHEPRAEDLRGPYADDDMDDIQDDEDEGRSGGSKGVMAAVVIGAVAAGIAGWYLFLREEPQQVAATTPVITADEQPYKVKPADPGGMDVPDTDKMVYDRLGQNSDGGQVENLLPEPESPTAPPVPADAGGSLEPLPEAEVAATPDPEPVDPAPADTAAAPEPAPEREPAPTQAAEAPAAAPSQPTPTTKPAAPEQPTQQAASETAPSQPEPQQQAATPAPVAPRSAASAPSGGGDRMVQLAALRDQAGAEAAWKKIQGANPDLLGNLSLDVERTDQGERGIFFRVRAKGLASADEAKALCEKLEARDQACLVVR
ncbi:hypothetical protein C882_3785 [Caenispirillum salinarum AK4]|uniref:SPOR domain-containing protein n=1 Tax=Caenispirillum salinarum AK4 TaxID=1238182 RepID=K9H1H0_9PROT|nr:SPOR domain-containing protein [Caenispirillum salinarum]EKV31412.1 hypothetical protein C882_3785 [Caenispirillum salinarum AK4]